VVLCHVCISAMKSKGVEKDKSDSSFLYTGFKNWKDTTVAFNSTTHKVELQLLIYQLLMEMLVKCYPLTMLKRRKTTSSVC